MAQGLANWGARVVRFEFPDMAKRRADGRQHAPDRLPKLLDAFRQQVAMENDTGKLVIGGKWQGRPPCWPPCSAWRPVPPAA